MLAVTLLRSSVLFIDRFMSCKIILKKIGIYVQCNILRFDYPESGLVGRLAFAHRDTVYAFSLTLSIDSVARALPARCHGNEMPGHRMLFIMFVHQITLIKIVMAPFINTCYII